MLLYKSKNIKEKINKHLKYQKVKVIKDYNFSQHTTFKTGGYVKVAYKPKTLNGAIEAFKEIKNQNLMYEIIGNGSNVLAQDSFYNGAVIDTTSLKGIIRVNDNTLFCFAGEMCSGILNYCESKCIGGLEFLYGIPATIGGVVCMNGGAGNIFISSCVKGVLIYDGALRLLSNKDCDFAYKNSTMRDIKCLILGVYLNVLPNCTNVADTINYFKCLRKCQPKGKSCGCIFKNVDGVSAGMIIDRCNLKGARFGKAHISMQHANFIINNGNNSADIKRLIDFVKEQVFNTCGITLQEEVVYFGHFDDYT
jgi:UDP-N-acetylmuramate dehydrogenase